MPQSWSIVVFCYNEADSVGGVIDSVVEFFDTRKVVFEIIVVDDGSTDDSEKSISDALRKHVHIKVIRHPKNLGMGEALRSGLNAASCENVVAIPADGQFDVSELEPYLNLERGSFVSFYRVENLQYTMFRKILSLANKLLNKWLNGIDLKDVNWVKIFKTEAIRSFNWEIRSSMIVSEICAKLIVLGHAPIEAPSIYHPRPAGDSKGASYRTVIAALRDMLKLVRVVRQFRKASKKI